MYPRRISLLLLCAGLVAGGPRVAAPAAPQRDGPARVRFDRDIRPILSNHCFGCHGFDAGARQADLRLDTAAGMTASAASGARVVVPGRPAESELVARVTSRDAEHRMPPAAGSDPLTSGQIELLTRWIAEGANWSQHWSFVAPRRQRLPPVADGAWARGPIDYFVLQRLDAEGITPSLEADRQTLLRRVALDLTGLPPSRDEVEAFARDLAPAAYERAVDRLLASPHYGERMARRWLDLARYADSSGYANDRLRSMWPYRDWVIRALNADMPFDQFTIEQLAGDLLPGASQSQIVGSGFHRNTPHQYEGGSDPEQYRVERVKNRLDTTGTVWLGLTVGCAQCHTHKFDPISQREYYQLYAFFNSADEVKQSVASDRQQRELSRLESEIAEVKRRLAGSAQDIPAAALKEKLQQLTKARDQFRGSLPTTLVFRERAQPRETAIQIRGDFLSPGEKVRPTTLSRLHAFGMPAEASANRLHLARWLVRSENPLTARVTMNRAWQHFFGQGIVLTENDFGHRGALPSHPHLLDWLAVEFSESGLSTKRLHRRIVRSATYRQWSIVRPELAQLDPRNRLLARQSRHRVEAEVIRDMALAASGLLNRKMGGPSVFPPIPPNVIGTSSAGHKWPTSGGGDRYRRGLYTAVYRANVYPMLSTFDGPDRDNACTKRNRSNTPLQSLSLANDPAMGELFRGLANRVLREAPQQDAQRMRHAFEVCLGRQPSRAEAVRLMAYLAHQRAHFESHPKAALRVTGDPQAAGRPATEVAAWFAVGRLLFNLDEFVTRE